MLSTTAIEEQPLSALSEPTNGAEGDLSEQLPFVANVTIRGVADLLFHAWNVEAIAEKANAAKGSKAKKSDAVETYVYRNEEGIICLPAEYLRMSIANAAKFRQDPRSPRKSALDLFKAGVVTLEQNAPIFMATGEPATNWEYIDKRRVMVQRNGITRHRPAFHSGWTATIPLMVTTPEYISRDFLHEVTSLAGRLVGVGDFRPSYGRFQVTNFEVDMDGFHE